MTKKEEASRVEALLRVIMMYAVIQVLSYLLLQVSCEVGVSDTWLKGLLGPLAAADAIPRFRYHSLLGNIGFVGVCLVILAAPFAYVVQPRRATLVLSAFGVIVWCLFGLGFSIDHI